MSNPFRMKRWSPYAVGVGIGVLSWITFAVMNTALGTSTTFPKLAALISYPVASDYVRSNDYYTSLIAPPKKVMFDWQLFLVAMLPVGALVAKKLARDDFATPTPEPWRSRFGSSVPLRFVVAFVGGAVMLFGARMADGCTSGHGISGGLQMAVSSWGFFMAMFVSGVVTAFALYGMKGRDHV